MRNYIEINGVSSLTLVGFAINTLPPISKPPIRNLKEEIDGRDGDIITKLGYGAYDKEIEVGLYGESYDINDIIAFFNTEGEVVFSNEPDKIYNFTILDQIDFEKLVKFKTAVITLHCQPFKYKKNEEPIEIEYQYVEGEGTDITLNNTEDQPLKMEFYGKASQSGSPSPSSSLPINIVSGDNEIVIYGKNFFDKSTAKLNKMATGTGGEIDFTGVFSSDYIKVQPNTNYYVNEYIPTVIAFDKNKNALGYIRNASGSATFTTANNCEYIRGRMFNADIDMTIALNKAMINLGTTSATYEEYNGSSYNINLPVENVFIPTLKVDTSNISMTRCTVSLTNDEYTFSATGSDCYFGNIVSTGTAYDKIYGTLYDVGGLTNLVFKPTNNLFDKNYVCYYDTDKVSLGYGQINNDTGLITIPNNNVKYIGFRLGISNSVNGTSYSTKFQLEKGSKSNSYTPFGTTPIEMCSSPDNTYKDYFIKDITTGNWYKYGIIGKIHLTSCGYRHGGLSTNTKAFCNFLLSNKDKTVSSGATNMGLCNNFSYKSGNANQVVSNNDNGLWWEGDTDYNYILITLPDASSLSKVNEWLLANPTYIYYVLGTPTTTQITYQPLIDQLDAILEALARKGQTNITQINNDLPFYIKATTREQGSDTATINNEGNIYSKPILELSGEGTIGVSLNGNQLFNVDLSDPNAIVIDPNQLEAYNPDTLNLMNRKVEGDIENLRLPIGENTLKVSGKLTKATITNYERWL